MTTLYQIATAALFGGGALWAAIVIGATTVRYRNRAIDALLYDPAPLPARQPRRP